MKRVISLILVVLMMASAIPMSVLVSAAESSSSQADTTSYSGYWDQYAASSFAGGSGTKDDPYQIASGEQLAYIEFVLTTGVYFELVSDIDLSAHIWRPFYSFGGNLCGNGYTIKGMYISQLGSRRSKDSDTMWDTGFSGRLSQTAVISDLNFYNPKVSITTAQQYYVRLGTVVGYSEGIIRNVEVYGGTLSVNCPTNEMRMSTGGIVGISSGDTAVVENCHYSGNITEDGNIGTTSYSSNSIGGIVGSASGVVRSCYSTGSLISTTSNSGQRFISAGGLAGDAGSCTITNCFSSMFVNAYAPKEVRAGGLIGTTASNAIISNCYASGDVAAQALNTSDETAGATAGGLIGRSWSTTISNCFTNNSQVKSSVVSGPDSSHVGKLIGQNNSGVVVNNCYSSNNTSVSYTKYTAGSGCNSPKVETKNEQTTFWGTDGFTYSESFIRNTLGWGIYQNLSNISSYPNNVWIYHKDGPKLFTSEISSLTIRYLRADSSVIDIYFKYYDNPSSVDVPSPKYAGLDPSLPVVSGTITQNAYVDVVYSTHIHTPGEASTCTSVQTCTLCGAVLVEKLPHPYEETVISATCEESGYTIHTCTVCGDTYHDQFTSPLGHQLNSSFTCTVCGTVFESALRDYMIYVYDRETGRPIEGAKVTLGDNTVVTDASGAVKYQLASNDSLALRIVAKSYPDYLVSTFVPSDLPSAFIYLESSESGIYEAFCNGDNVLLTSSQINALAPTLEAKIVVSGRAKANITRYELVQDGTVIATSTDGVFVVKNPYFKQKKDVYVRMYTDGAQGYNVYERKLNIKVVGFTLDAETDWGKLLPFSGGLSYSFPEGTPVFEGLNFKIPAYIIGKDGFMNIEIGNQKLIATFGDKRDYTDDGTDVDNKTRSEILKKMRDDWIEQNNPNAWPEGDKTNEVTASFGIVFEFGENGVETVYGQANVAYELSYETGKTFLVWYIPIYAEIEAGFTGEAEITEIGYDFEKAEVLIPDFELQLHGDVSLLGGLGCSVISAGVYGAAGAEFIFGVNNMEDYVKYRVFGQLGLYARIKLFFWKELEYKLPLLQGEFYGPNGVVAAKMAMLNLNSYLPVSREYLANRSQWLSISQLSDATDSYVPLQTSSYTAIEPQVVVAGDTIMMVFLDDDGREGLNYQHLYYSIFNQSTNTWGVPQRVDDNDYSDIEYEVYSDGSKIYIAYTEAGNITVENQDNYEEILSSVEVIVTHYDAQNDCFTDHTNVSQNDSYDTLPQLSMTPDGIAVAWVNNFTNDVFAQNANNVVMTATCVGNTWTVAKVLTERGATVVSMDMGMLNGTAYVATIRDVDCDLSTVDDRVLYLIDFAGNITQIITAENKNDGVQFVQMNGENQLLWYNNSNLYRIASLVATPAFIFASEVDGLSGNYKFVQIGENEYAILFTKNERSVDRYGNELSRSNIYGIFYSNGKWGSPVPVTEIEAGRYIDAYDACMYDGKLLIPYISTETTVTENDIIRNSDFMSAYVDLSGDLIVGDAVYLPGDLFEGNTIEVKVPVTNNSWQKLKGVSCYVLDSQGNCILESSISSINGIWAESGATEYVDVELPKNILTVGENYSVYISPMDWSDADTSNNTTQLQLWYTDFTVDAERVLLSGKTQIQYAVTNDGNIGGNAVLKIYKRAADGKTEIELYSIVIEDLAAGKTVSGLITVTDQFYADGSDTGSVFISVVPENTELYSFNDTMSLMVGGLTNGGTTEVVNPDDIWESPVIDAPYVVYDKKSGADISAIVNENGCTFVELVGIEAANYRYESGNLVLNAAYLRTLDAGYHYFTLCYNGNNQTTEIILIVEITDSTFIDVEITAKDQSVKYDGYPVNLDRDLVYETLSQGEVSVAYSIDGGNTWIQGLPTELGVYTVRLTVSEDTLNGYASAECTFTLTIVKGIRAISVPLITDSASNRLYFGNAVPTAGILDGTILYGYSTVNDVSTVSQWSETGILPEVGESTTYYLFAKMVGGQKYEDAYSLGYSVDAHVHQYEGVITAPTCTDQGYTTHTCRCGDSYVNSYVPVTDHSFGEWYETIIPQCETMGEECRECDNCDHYETREVKALGHDLTQHAAKAPTCTNIGWNAYETCLRCDYSTYVELPIVEHTYTSTVVPPTTSAEGYTLHTCTVCGHEYKDNFVDKLTYILGDVNADEQVDSADAIHLLRHTLFPMMYSLNQSGDFNGDGSVDSADAIHLLRHTLFPSMYPLKSANAAEQTANVEVVAIDFRKVYSLVPSQKEEK